MLADLTAHRNRVPTLMCAAALLLPAGAALAASDDGPKTVRASVSSSGAQGETHSDAPSLSANGRFVTWTSASTTLVPGDTNGSDDIFVRDLKTGKTERVSVSSKGRAGNDFSREAAISGNGRYVAFSSFATNLVPGRDRNGRDPDVFLRDRKLHKTIRVSVSSKGKQGSGESVSISHDGHLVAFVSRNQLAPADRKNAHPDVFVRNVKTRKTTLVSASRTGGHADNYSSEPSISANGRFVAFTTHADNLVAGDTFRGNEIVVRDLKARKTRLVSVNSDGVQADRGSGMPAISADGRFVSFWSIAPNLAAGHRNGVSDVFLRDLKKRTTEWVSVNTAGGQSQEGGYTNIHAVSAHGEFVLFTSTGRDLVAGDTSENGEFLFDNDVFVRDVAANKTRRVSVNDARQSANDNAYGRAISANGRFVAFASAATNLDSGDTNGAFDVFVRGPLAR